MIWLCSITLADKSAKDKPPSVVGFSRLTLLDCLTTWVYLDNTRTHMRVLFYMVICASVFAENWGRFHSPLVPLAWFSMSRLPKHFCAHWSQHLPCRCFFFVYCSRMIFGYFSKKSTFIKISLPLYLPNPPRVKNQGRTKDEPRNTQRTPNHPKVLFIKIGYLKEIFVTVASAICLPCQMPLSISFTPLCKVSLHSRTSSKMSHRW